MILESFSVFTGNAEAILKADGGVGYKIENEICQNTTASKGVYINALDSSISVEMEVTTSAENSSVTSLVGVKKSKNTNTGWESVPVTEPAPVVVPDEKEWWEEGWDFLCDIGEGFSNGIESVADWMGDNKETVDNAIIVIALLSAIPSGGMSLAYLK